MFLSVCRKYKQQGNETNIPLPKEIARQISCVISSTTQVLIRKKFWYQKIFCNGMFPKYLKLIQWRALIDRQHLKGIIDQESPRERHPIVPNEGCESKIKARYNHIVGIWSLMSTRNFKYHQSIIPIIRLFLLLYMKLMRPKKCVCVIGP